MAVYISSVELVYCIVAMSHVLSRAILIAQRPEDDARVVAVAKYHAYVAVHEGLRPRRIACQTVVPMALEVCLIHHIQTIGIKHSIHLLMARIVARADDIDIGLLHQCDVAQHRFIVHISSIEGVRVVSVHTLKEDTLAVDGIVVVVALVDELYVTESVLRSKYHLLLAISDLRDDDII